jgi:hypothetical protein
VPTPVPTPEPTPTPTPTATAPTPLPTVDYSRDPASLLAKRDGASDVAPYATALDQLQQVCTQDRVRLAGFGDSGFSDLVKNGVLDETRLTVLQHLFASIPPSGSKIDCQSVLAVYLILREGG